MEFAHTLADALRLTALRRPSHRWRRIGPTEFWLAAVLLLAVNLFEAFLSVPAPRQFDLDALRGLSFFILLALLVAWATCALLRRPALFWPFATLVLLVETLVGTAVLLLDNTLIDWLWPNRDPDTDRTALLLWLAWTLLAVRRMFDHVEPQRGWAPRGRWRRSRSPPPSPCLPGSSTAAASTTRPTGTRRSSPLRSRWRPTSCRRN